MRNFKLKIGANLTTTGEKLVERLERKGVVVGRRAKIIFLETSFRVTSEEKTINLAIVSMEELGLGQATIEQIYREARSSGLKPCQDKIALWFRLRYDAQPEGEFLVVATDPPASRKGDLRLFEIFCTKGSKRYITTLGGDHKKCFNDTLRWVFQKN